MLSKTNRIQNTVLSVIFLILSIMMLFPFYIMIITAMKTPAELMNPELSLLPETFNLSNFVEAMGVGDWPLYFYNTILITVITIVVSLVINSLAGYAFARIKFPGANILFFISLIGLMIPQQVTMLPLFIFLKNFPLVGGNDLFGAGGTGFVNTYAGMLMPYIAGSFGVFMFRQHYLNFPSALDDAAKIDGLSRIGTYFHIYMPLSKPIFATLACLKATQTWNEYTWPLIITTAGDDIMTVQLALSAFRSDTETQWHLLMAATFITMIPLIILFLFAQRSFVDGIATSGIKG